jgi:hypothetical protein
VAKPQPKALEKAKNGIDLLILVLVNKMLPAHISRKDAKNAKKSNKILATLRLCVKKFICLCLKILAAGANFRHEPGTAYSVYVGCHSYFRENSIVKGGTMKKR